MRTGTVKLLVFTPCISTEAIAPIMLILESLTNFSDTNRSSC